jgi:hypothetical protein
MEWQLFQMTCYWDNYLTAYLTAIDGCYMDKLCNYVTDKFQAIHIPFLSRLLLIIPRLVIPV